MISSTLGYLVDVQDHILQILQENCTPDGALEYLRQRNWRGRRTVWFAYDTDESYECEDADLGFAVCCPPAYRRCRMTEHTLGPWRCDDHPAEADARLQAAAPDLLEACKVCVEALHDHLQYDNPEEGSLERDAYNTATAAIARAEGGATPQATPV